MIRIGVSGVVASAVIGRAGAGVASADGPECGAVKCASEPLVNAVHFATYAWIVTTSAAWLHVSGETESGAPV